MDTLNSRAQAALILLDVVDHQKSLTAVLSKYSQDTPHDQQAMVHSLCYGVCRHFFSVNALSKMLLDKPLPENARSIHALLWVGLYQLAYTDTSDHAAINETVEAASQLKSSKFKGVLNAILRRFQREKESLLADLASSEVPAYEHPKWLIKALKKAWPDHWQTICTEANKQAPMALRVNTNLQSVSEYLQTLLNSGIKALEGECALTSIYLKQPISVSKLPGFSEGSCSVQDEAAQLSAQLLTPQKGERVLDACCAPGGKTCHLLEHVNNDAEVVAIDADSNRLVRVHENLARLGLSADVKQGEAQSPENWWDGKPFDRILLDVPCSATGVIRRHPDIKLLRQKEDIDNLAALQQSILRKAWELLKPGGTLLYATCSILPVENRDNVQQFLAFQSDAELVPLTLSTGVDTGFGQQLFPQQGGHDGFFYALLKKA